MYTLGNKNVLLGLQILNQFQWTGLEVQSNMKDIFCLFTCCCKVFPP